MRDIELALKLLRGERVPIDEIIQMYAPSGNMSTTSTLPEGGGGQGGVNNGSAGSNTSVQSENGNVPSVAGGRRGVLLAAVLTGVIGAALLAVVGYRLRRR